MRVHVGLVFTPIVVACLLVPAAAFGAPPANDNRAVPELIGSFPATIAGTTVDATVERLDPQVSDCGRVESTVWYRIEQAPDGTIVLDVQGASLAPVLRVYSLRKNSIEELTCASAKRARPALVSFRTERGASYLVLVGKRAGTGDGPFTLHARLFLPPTNDARGQAERAGPPPFTVRGTTFGATSGFDDPEECGLSAGTVWYTLRPGSAQRVVLRLAAAGDLDATMVVLGRVRSRTSVIGCADTNASGTAVLAFTVTAKTTYLVAIGRQEDSPPGDFALSGLAAQAPEKAPGGRLPLRGVQTTVDGLTDVNDVWWTEMRAGSTYRIALRSEGCARVRLSGPLGELRRFTCNGYATFTPGPDGGGRYVLEVLAPRGARRATYRLVVAPAGIDDVGVGIVLRNLRKQVGRLEPTSVDVVDVYHFDVPQRADVRLRLAQQRSTRFSMRLLTDTGLRIATGAGEISRRLDRGRYVLAVTGQPGTPAGQYRLALVVREVTATMITADVDEVVPGESLVFRIATLPVPDAGRTSVQIDRFDPLEGWQFHRKLTVPGAGGGLTWKPPFPGRWRARASFLGTLHFSPSVSAYVQVLVATPLAPDVD